MDIIELKKYIIENSHIEKILENIGCHSIKFHNGSPDDYYTCANPDGDNTNAITVYINDYLPCINYTRNISKTKSFSPDLIALVEYCESLSFFEALKHICEILGLNFYGKLDDDIPESLRITKMIMNLSSNKEIEEDEPIRVIDENILKYYKPYVNDMFKDDGISYETQSNFEIGYDELTNMITIPIRSELGDLVGVKGRIFSERLSPNKSKYYYIERCPRNKILYGLYKTLKYIEQKKECYVTESEKGVMQLWDLGIRNSIGIGGKKISNQQIIKISRVSPKIILCFDKDVDIKELEEIAERFVDEIEVWAIYDDDSLLDEHESPTDSKNKFYKLLKDNLIRIK